MTAGSKESRNTYLDTIKGIAIIFVVFGHCIQYGSGLEFLYSQSFFENVLFKFIYSFHMPLFVLVSGYLFYFSAQKKSVVEVFLSQLKSLVIPIIVWEFLYTLFQEARYLYFTHNRYPMWQLKAHISDNYWFLWAIFTFSLVVILINKVFHDNILVYIIILGTTVFIPENYWFSCIGYLLPFYLIGYFFCKYRESLLEFYRKHAVIITIVGLAVWIALMHFYNVNCYIYTSGFCILGKDVKSQLLTNLFRFVIGVFGSLQALSIVYVLKKLFDIYPIRALGQRTKGIYIISNLLMPVLSAVTDNLQYNCMWTILECIAMLAVSVGIIIVLEKIKISRRYLLGMK